ncbi:hypothetical protein GCM10027299_21490 [Larkinella ripae]
MKRDLKTVRDLLGEKRETKQKIYDTVSKENRARNDEEKRQWGELSKEIDDLEEEEKFLVDAETNSKRMAAPVDMSVQGKDPSEKDKRDFSKYSFTRAILSQVKASGVSLDGVELEMHQEAEKEARANNVTISGVGVPSQISKYKGVEQRDNSVTMPTQPEDGSAAVQTDKRISLEDMLRNALMVRNLGATYFNDLVGNVDFVHLTQRPVATWKPEVGNLDKSNVKFGSKGISPKRLGTYTVHSLQFLKQTAPSVEAKIRQELAYSIAEGIDYAAVFGDGADGEPTGLLATSGTTDIAIGTNGGALTRAHLVTAIATLLSKNINGRNYGWLFNALTAGALMNTPIATNSDKFLMESLSTLMNYPAALSNAIPSATTKGSGSNLSTLIFGAWENLYIAQWGGYDLLVDPYTLAKAGQVQIIIQAFADILVYEPKAFVTIKDVKNQ